MKNLPNLLVLLLTGMLCLAICQSARALEKKVRLVIPGCAWGHADRISSILQSIDGVIRVEDVDLVSHIADVIFDDATTSTDQIKSELENGGYPVESYHFFHAEISPQEAKDMVDTDPDVTIIDVRESSEFCLGHVPCSRNYPWNSGILEERYGELPADGNVLVCGNEDQHHSAAEFLDTKGFVSVHDIGEMNGWEWETVTCCHDMGLGRAILALGILAGVRSDDAEGLVDVNGDGRVGVAEVICILEAMASLDGQR